MDNNLKRPGDRAPAGAERFGDQRSAHPKRGEFA